jgi:hypothetical protein
MDPGAESWGSEVARRRGNFIYSPFDRAIGSSKKFRLLKSFWVLRASTSYRFPAAEQFGQGFEDRLADNPGIRGVIIVEWA